MSSGNPPQSSFQSCSISAIRKSNQKHIGFIDDSFILLIGYLLISKHVAFVKPLKRNIYTIYTTSGLVGQWDLGRHTIRGSGNGCLMWSARKQPLHGERYTQDKHRIKKHNDHLQIYIFIELFVFINKSENTFSYFKCGDLHWLEVLVELNHCTRPLHHLDGNLVFIHFSRIASVGMFGKPTRILKYITHIREQTPLGNSCQLT